MEENNIRNYYEKMYQLSMSTVLSMIRSINNNTYTATDKKIEIVSACLDSLYKLKRALIYYKNMGGQ